MTNSPCILPACRRCAFSAYLNQKEMYCTKRYPIIKQRNLTKTVLTSDNPPADSGCPLYKRNCWRDNLRDDVTEEDIRRLSKYYL